MDTRGPLFKAFQSKSPLARLVAILVIEKMGFKSDADVIGKLDKDTGAVPGLPPEACASNARPRHACVRKKRPRPEGGEAPFRYEPLPSRTLPSTILTFWPAARRLQGSSWLRMASFSAAGSGYRWRTRPGSSPGDADDQLEPRRLAPTSAAGSVKGAKLDWRRGSRARGGEGGRPGRGPAAGRSCRRG